eukprot:gnl/TRDRNA2_/TRDRNA2_84577_c0_seq1.p1 gnl/TRDRNA2_/TRDRNA2_84577_c0~~gnl/TRDRNA2_/TRDRNA2_84577_c0_seq1.p1  ORF type:complete len:409 (-),score=73.48 gnl/TRDRNA2_/TRDRNA2_84577_c0_seq1:131-1357(-)
MSFEDAADRSHPKPSQRTCGDYSYDYRLLPKGETIVKSASTPSIPSRIETVIFKGNREVKGFGSRALRFEAGIKDEEVPGPGCYERRKDCFEEYNERFGWGKRGTGGFASRSRRFGARSLPTMPTYGRGCPGPGAYQQVEPFNALKLPKYYNKAKVTSAFAPPAEKSAASKLKGDAPPMPGPGQYDHNNFPRNETEYSFHAAFNSKARRCDDGPTGDTGPGPGEYLSHDGSRRLPPTDPALVGVTHGGKVNFQEPCRRKIVPIHKDLPTSDAAGRGLLGEFADTVGTVCGGQQGPSMLAAQPGPGHYNQDRDTMWEGALAGTYGTSAFQPNGKRGDWAPEGVGELPGPGQYNPKQLPPPVKFAVFPSTGRELSSFSQGKAVPGPAFYTPKLPANKKSFLLNPSRKWAA